MAKNGVNPAFFCRYISHSANHQPLASQIPLRRHLLIPTVRKPAFLVGTRRCRVRVNELLLRLSMNTAKPLHSVSSGERLPSIPAHRRNLLTRSSSHTLKVCQLVRHDSCPAACQSGAARRVTVTSAAGPLNSPLSLSFSTAATGRMSAEPTAKHHWYRRTTEGWWEKRLANLRDGKTVNKETHSGCGQETKWEMSSKLKRTAQILLSIATVGAISMVLILLPSRDYTAIAIWGWGDARRQRVSF